MLSDGRRLRSALAIGLWWSAGHGVTLFVVGVGVMWTGVAFPPRWQGGIEALVGATILVLGATLLVRHWRGSVHWHEHRHSGSVHSHFHRHRPARRAGGKRQSEGAHLHDHDGPGRMRAVAVGAIHGLAGSGPLVILLVVAFAHPGERYAALGASALGTFVGMLMVTAFLALPFAWSRRLDPVWYARVQVGAGVFGVIFGLAMTARALGGI
jgi:hypothetical protein